MPQSASGMPGHGLSAVAKTENLGCALPGQDRMCPLGIIRVATQ